MRLDARNSQLANEASEVGGEVRAKTKWDEVLGGGDGGGEGDGAGVSMGIDCGEESPVAADVEEGEEFEYDEHHIADATTLQPTAPDDAAARRSISIPFDAMQPGRSGFAGTIYLYRITASREWVQGVEARYYERWVCDDSPNASVAYSAADSMGFGTRCEAAGDAVQDVQRWLTLQFADSHKPAAAARRALERYAKHLRGEAEKEVEEAEASEEASKEASEEESPETEASTVMLTNAIARAMTEAAADSESTAEPSTEVAAPAPALQYSRVEAERKAQAAFDLRVREARDRLSEATVERIQAQLAAKQAKKCEDVAYEELQDVLADGPEKLPLFDGIVEPVDSVDASPASADADAAGDPMAPPASAPPTAWRDLPIETLQEHDVSSKIVQLLVAAGIETLGNLADWTAADKPLTRIEGVGKAKGERIENAMMAFWAVHPEYCGG